MSYITMALTIKNEDFSKLMKDSNQNEARAFVQQAEIFQDDTFTTLRWPWFDCEDDKL